MQLCNRLFNNDLNLITGDEYRHSGKIFAHFDKIGISMKLVVQC